MLAVMCLLNFLFFSQSTFSENVSLVTTRDQGARLNQESKTSSTTVVKSVDPATVFLDSWYSSIEQAESIERELLKLIYNDSSLPAKSLLGNLKTVLAKSLKKKNVQAIYSCQKFSVQKKSLSSFSVYETCIPKERPEILYFEGLGKDQLQVTFYLQSLHDIVGFGSSILRRTARCKLQKTGDELSKMNCKDVSSSRKPEEVMVLDEIVYQKDGSNVLTARGKYYRELLPSKSISIQVPKEGKVVLDVRLIERPKAKPASRPESTPQALPIIPANSNSPSSPESFSGTPGLSDSTQNLARPVERNSNANELRSDADGGQEQKRVEGVFATPPEGSMIPEVNVNKRGRYQVNPLVPNEIPRDEQKPQE